MIRDCSVLLLALVAGCGGGKFDGNWSGNWSSNFTSTGDSALAPIDITVSGGKFKGTTSQFSVTGKLQDDGTATTNCSGKCWGFDAPGDASGTVVEVDGELFIELSVLQDQIRVLMHLMKTGPGAS